MTEPLRGFWSTTGDARVVEAAAAVGPDFVCIDTQHGVDIATIAPVIFTTLAHYGVPGLVRVETNLPSSIGRALDLGASGVMVPMVETADDAQRAADALRYAPEGSRSYGVQTPRIDPLEFEPTLAVQVETEAAVGNLDEIASVEGVDWLYIGPADLGLALCGVPASDVVAVFDGSHPKAEIMREAFDAVVEAARRHGRHAGLHTTTAEGTIGAERRGFTVSAIASDLTEVTRGLAKSLETARDA